MNPGEWRDLADSELRAKLEQRGFSPATVENCIRHRDDEQFARALDRVLGVE